MCFAPQADLVGGVVVAGIGIDACRHLRGRDSHLLLAGLPVLLGAHQVVEAAQWFALYVVAVCGALLFSGYRHIAVFGIANLIAVAVLAWLTVDGLASLWCAYAAIAAGAVALHMRYAKPHRGAPLPVDA